MSLATSLLFDQFENIHKFFGYLITILTASVIVIKCLPITGRVFKLTRDSLYRTNSSDDWNEANPVPGKYTGGPIYGLIWRTLYPAYFSLHCLVSALILGNPMSAKKRAFDIARLRLERRILEFDDKGKKISDISTDEYAQVATFDNVSDLLKLDEQITPYFRALEKHGSARTDEPLESLTKINITEGFVAPMFLLSGLLPRLEEDWRVVGEKFEVWQKMAKDHFPKLQDIVSLQSFLLDCWLLWGPSISLPRMEVDEHHNLLTENLCDCWNHSNYTTIQYGYGDENNSICLTMDKLEAVKAINGWNAQAGFADNKKPKIQYPYALPANLKDSRLWFTNEPFNVINGKAERKEKGPIPSFGPATISAGHPGWDRSFGLKIKSSNEIKANTEIKRGRYYSAYLWTLFVTLREDNGKLVFHKQALDEWNPVQDPNCVGTWRNMLTFFEHGNIADADAYHFLEKHLAVKTAHSLWTLSENFENHEPKPLFVYGGALDDLNCEQCKSVESDEQHLWRKIDEELNVLKANKESDWNDEPKALAVRKRVVMPSDPRHPLFKPKPNQSDKWTATASEELEKMKGCNLFGVVAEYYKWLETKPESETHS